MQRYSSATLHVSLKTPISEWSNKIPSQKSKFYHKFLFLSDLILKLLNIFVFESLA